MQLRLKNCDDICLLIGKEAFNELYQATFETYLSEVVGQKFDPPITFQLRPFNTLEVFPAMKYNEVLVPVNSARHCLTMCSTRWTFSSPTPASFNASAFSTGWFLWSRLSANKKVRFSVW